MLIAGSTERNLNYPLIISNSEVDTALRCQKLHYYQYALGLYPRKLSHANHIGLLGHHVLETYYRAMKDGASRDDAFQLGWKDIERALDEPLIENDVVSIVSTRFMQYHKHYAHDTFEIVDVEGVYTYPVNDKVTFGLTLDLLVKYNSGPWAGQYVVIDHKYKYNFLSPDELSMHAQTYKYIWTLQQKGYHVKRAMINQIRYRMDVKDPDKIFKRAYLVPKGQAHLDNIMAEHMKVAEEIHSNKTQPVSWYGDVAKRRLYSRDCAGCYFRLPCHLELIGKDNSSVLADMYAPEDPNTFYRPYGY